MTAHDRAHDEFILSIFNVYLSQIHDELFDWEEFCDVTECPELVQNAKNLNWKGNLEAIIADLDRRISCGDLPQPFEQGHCRKLAASRGYQMKEVSREPRITYTLFKIADGTYLHNQSAIDCHNNRNIFTEWQAYEHLLNLPRIV